MPAGFVYLLGNRAMPCYYKIGCTGHSPHARARELSAASGIPVPFDVLLYIEVDDYQRVEQQFHREIADFRASRAREFFCFGPAHMNWLWWLFRGRQDRLAFTECDWHRYGSTPTFPDEYEETWVFDDTELCLPNVAPLEPGDFKLVVA